ncbi:MAG: hypothetical protein ACW98F_00080 [Candidatus Hodarchaeales archaeon]
MKLFYINNDDDRTYKGFGPITATVKTRGITNLLQKVAKMLLTTLGSDRYTETVGSDLNYILSQGSVKSRDEVSSLVTIALGQVEDNIKSQQADETNLEDEETLVSLDLRRVEFMQSDLNWDIDVLVRNLKNETYLLRI